MDLIANVINFILSEELNCQILVVFFKIAILEFNLWFLGECVN